MKYYACATCNEIGTHGWRYTRDFAINEFPHYCYYEHNDDLVVDLETAVEARKWLDWMRRGKTEPHPWQTVDAE